jgi:hypothetical protein
MANDFFSNCIDNNKLYTEGKTLINIIQDPEVEE